MMVDNVEINDPVDWAIIQSFYRAEKHILMLKKIVSIVRESSDKKDKTIEARIRKFVEKKYLIKMGSDATKCHYDTSSNSDKIRRSGLYGLNEDLEFEYTGVSLNSHSSIVTVPDEIRRNHANDLKEAVKKWIDYFPKPTYNLPIERDIILDMPNHDREKRFDRYYFNITMCERHPLFVDLRNNHLPETESNVFLRWDEYKAHLAELFEMKAKLFNSILKGVKSCFKELKLNYYHTKPDLPLAGGYGYDFPKLIYLNLIEYVSGVRYIDSSILSSCKNRDIIMDTFSVEWRCNLGSIWVPKEGYDLLLPGLDAFAIFIEEIFRKDKFAKEAGNILEKIRILEPECYSIIRELERVLLYASYPGECRYLR